jgi:hypothetical protein
MVGMLGLLHQDLQQLLQQGKGGNVTFNNTMQSGVNAQKLASAVNSLMGYSYESNQRGVG